MSKATDHGHRATYRHGCRCLPCRAANATYEAKRRADRRSGRRSLWDQISPTEARKLIAQLQREQVTRRELARRLGLRNHAVRLHPTAITVRKFLKIRRLYRLLMAEDRGDQPDAHL